MLCLGVPPLNGKKYTVRVFMTCWVISQHFAISILCSSLFHWSNGWVQRCWGRRCQDRPQPNLLPAAKRTSGHRQKRSADAQHARRINRDNSIHACLCWNRTKLAIVVSMYACMLMIFDDICIYLFGLPSMIVLLASQNKSFGFLAVSPYVIWSLTVFFFFRAM